MNSTKKDAITVQTSVNAPIAKVWDYWSNPTHIIKWNNASADWHTPKAENDFRPGGRFVSRMEAKDGSYGFDFAGTNTFIDPYHAIQYTIDDGRKVSIVFDTSVNDSSVKITETFEAETSHSQEQQKEGWQNILDNFKKYTEEN